MTVQALRLRTLSTLLGSYFAFGLYWGVWVVVFADYLAARGLTAGQAGLQPAALSIASILTMTLLSPRPQRLGPPRAGPPGGGPPPPAGPPVPGPARPRDPRLRRDRDLVHGLPLAPGAAGPPPR